MIFFAVTFILGIIFEYFLGFGWAVGVLIFLISLFLFFYFSRSQGQPLNCPSPKGLPLGKIILIVGIGFGLGVLRMNLADNYPDINFYKSVGQKIYFEATISKEPDVRDASARYTVNPVNSKSLVLLVSDRFPEFKYGDKIKVSGKLDLPKNFKSENGTEFDYVSFLAKDKINFLIYSPSIDPISFSSTELHGTRKIISALYALKNIFIKNISAVVPEPNSSFLSGVIFGTKQSLGEALLNNFKKVGLIHIVVLSGYNITIIAIGVFYMTAFLNRRNLSFILSIIFIVLFATMVGWGATVVRAVIMALIAMLARFLGRPADALRWLFIAALIMLLWNPLILFYDPSFQLSFMATLGLILFSQFIFDFISVHKIGKYIRTKFGLREIVSSTLAVQFFVLPILIKMSGFISLISFLINPLILPLVPWLMAFGALTGAVGLIPFVGQVLSWPFGVVSYFISQIIIYLTNFSAEIPLSTLQTGSISLWFILVWYLGYGIFYWRLKNKNIFYETK